MHGSPCGFVDALGIPGVQETKGVISTPRAEPLVDLSPIVICEKPWRHGLSHGRSLLTERSGVRLLDLTLFLRTSLSTEREIHSSGGFGSMRMLRSLSITSFSFLVSRSRCSTCSFQEGTTTSIWNLFGWFRSSYKCHLYAPFRKKISRASRINSTHSFRRVGSIWNCAVIDTGPSCGAGGRVGSRPWEKIVTGADSKVRLLVKSIDSRKAGTTRTMIIITNANPAAPRKVGTTPASLAASPPISPPTPGS